jgi:hypothetical protein
VEVLVKRQQVVVNELVAGALQCLGGQLQQLLQSVVAIEADPASIGNKAQKEIQQLGWCAELNEEPARKQTKRYPAKRRLDFAKAVWPQKLVALHLLVRGRRELKVVHGGHVEEVAACTVAKIV